MHRMGQVQIHARLSKRLNNLPWRDAETAYLLIQSVHIARNFHSSTPPGFTSFTA